ncbi:MAG TPA: HAMP domain-containing sensor histidine kinase, partial [Cellvibrionaceae bacterium]
NAAKELLGLGNNEELALSVKRIPEIVTHLQNRQNPSESGTSVTLPSTSGGEVKLSTANLELSADTGTLIFVEDNRALTQQAQQLKLASLGRLTASIAHEIRNPLGAIGHATQLLAESTDLAPADLRLLDIINVHTKRVNQIIENIFQVSKRKLSEPQIIDLSSWLKSFTAEYGRNKQLETGKDISAIIQVKQGVKPLYIRFDESQLQQVLSNLLDNALRYIKSDSYQPPITLTTGLDTIRNTPYLSIIDNGQGVSADNQKHLFEPFFTTENTGSGLGLFLCKELCEANQAYISYIADDQQPSCFTIQFAHSEKVQQ